MLYFLELVAQHIHKNYAGDLDSLCVVLPNKRGGLYLKKHLAGILNKPSWIPEIISAEDFVEKISNLPTASELTLTFELYNTYCKVVEVDAVSFEQFLRWAPQVMQDFNEIDRYLIEPETIFENLRNIKEIESWSLGEEKLTAMQENYLAFMQNLGKVYKLMKENALATKQAWQGLSYRVAYERVAKNGYTLPYKKILFCGFNAVNLAEEKIISFLVEKNIAEILWDADTYYLKDSAQEAGSFLRKHFTRFTKQKNFVSDALTTSVKHIEIIGVAGRMAQVAAAMQALNKILENDTQLQKTAIVLADETLLLPVLSALPEKIHAVNITLEYPTHITPLYGLYEETIQAHLNKKPNEAFYFKDVLSILYNPIVATLVNDNVALHKTIKKINQSNIIYLRTDLLKTWMGETFTDIEFLLSPFTSVEDFVLRLCKFNEKLIQKTHDTQHRSLELETALIFQQNLNTLQQAFLNYPQTSLKALKILVKQTLAPNGIPFYGEPLSGLQIMGVLETRTLDFDNIIMLSVNENVLPAGKSGASFIPDDLKRFLQMPLYSEKDAIYAYHFYRLLQRVNKAALIYNTETDTFGKGEKSRFITQLLSELKEKNKQAVIEEKILSLPVNQGQQEFEIHIQKTESVLSRLTEKAQSEKGLSPTSLNTYKECELKFYYRFIANIKEPDEVDENMEASAIGNIIHKTLEKIYTPLLDKVLTKENISALEKIYQQSAEEVFIEHYKEPVNENGKKTIALHVIKKHIANLLSHEKETIEDLEKKKESITIKHLEKNLTANIFVNIGSGIIPINLSGTIDRIDFTPSTFRIIDYKSSVKKEYDTFNIESLSEVFTDAKYSKVLQLLVYAWLAWKNKIAEAEKISACIIPFRAQERVYKITLNKRPLILTTDFLAEFEDKLSAFIAGIFNAKTNFNPTEELETCQLCAYQSICNRN
ncbi:MAG TPA: PD-(D/E)XK nuclease family protein [Bacteroidia bacterium]|nr:PD-(D/E)XK nuclease family protein [Bacteroidia bacterium]